MLQDPNTQYVAESKKNSPDSLEPLVEMQPWRLQMLRSRYLLVLGQYLPNTQPRQRPPRSRIAHLFG